MRAFRITITIVTILLFIVGGIILTYVRNSGVNPRTVEDLELAGYICLGIASFISILALIISANSGQSQYAGSSNKSSSGSSYSPPVPTTCIKCGGRMTRINNNRSECSCGMVATRSPKSPEPNINKGQQYADFKENARNFGAKFPSD